MKKFLIFIMLLTCSFSCFACNQQQSDSSSENSNSSVETLGKLPYTYKEIDRYEYFQLFLETADVEAKWSSSNDNVASVDQNGRVFGVSKGTAIITATVDGQSYTCEIAVKDLGYIPTVQIDLVYENVQLTKDSQFTLVPYLMYNGKSYADAKFTYTVEDAEVAIIDEDGKITAKAIGTTQITINATWRGCEDILSCRVDIIVE